MLALHRYVPLSKGPKLAIIRVPFLAIVVRPCGNETNSLDQTTVGGGKPKARQRTEATEFAGTLVSLSGVWMKRGGAKFKRKPTL